MKFEDRDPNEANTIKILYICIVLLFINNGNSIKDIKEDKFGLWQLIVETVPFKG